MAISNTYSDFLLFVCLFCLTVRWDTCINSKLICVRSSNLLRFSDVSRKNVFLIEILVMCFVEGFFNHTKERDNLGT